MSFPSFRTVRGTFTPAAVATQEWTDLFALRAGERLLSISVVPLVVAGVGSTSQIVFGDSTDDDGYVTQIDTETMVVGTPISQAGALLANSGGRMATAAINVRARYGDITTITNNPATPGAVAPSVRYVATIQKDVP